MSLPFPNEKHSLTIRKTCLGTSPIPREYLLSLNLRTRTVRRMDGTTYVLDAYHGKMDATDPRYACHVLTRRDKKSYDEDLARWRLRKPTLLNAAPKRKPPIPTHMMKKPDIPPPLPPKRSAASSSGSQQVELLSAPAAALRKQDVAEDLFDSLLQRPRQRSPRRRQGRSKSGARSRSVAPQASSGMTGNFLRFPWRACLWQEKKAKYSGKATQMVLSIV